MVSYPLSSLAALARYMDYLSLASDINSQFVKWLYPPLLTYPFLSICLSNNQKSRTLYLC